MKKKIKLLILLLIILFPFNVSAISIRPILICPSSVEQGKEIECNFSVDVGNNKISGISAKYYYDNKIGNLSIINSKSWQGNANNNQIDFYDYVDYTGIVDISKIRFKIKDNAKIGKTKIKFQIIEIALSNGTPYRGNEIIEREFNVVSKSVIHTTTKPTTKPTTRPKTTTKHTTSSKPRPTIKPSSKPKTTTKNNTKSTTTTDKKNTTTKISTRNETTNNENKTTITKLTDKEDISSKSNTSIYNSNDKEVNNNNNKLNDYKSSIILLILFIILIIIIAILFIREICKKNKEDK